MGEAGGGRGGPSSPGTGRHAGAGPRRRGRLGDTPPPGDPREGAGWGPLRGAEEELAPPLALLATGSALSPSPLDL